MDSQKHKASFRKLSPHFYTMPVHISNIVKNTMLDKNERLPKAKA